MDTIMVDDSGLPLRDQGGGVHGDGEVNPVWFGRTKGRRRILIPKASDVFSVADLVADWYESQPGRRNGVKDVDAGRAV